MEDLTGSVEVLFFPGTYAEVGMTIAEDAIVIVKGKVDKLHDPIASYHKGKSAGEQTHVGKHTLTRVTAMCKQEQRKISELT